MWRRLHQEAIILLLLMPTGNKKRRSNAKAESNDTLMSCAYLVYPKVYSQVIFFCCYNCQGGMTDHVSLIRLLLWRIQDIRTKKYQCRLLWKTHSGEGDLNRCRVKTGIRSASVRYTDKPRRWSTTRASVCAKERHYDVPSSSTTTRFDLSTTHVPSKYPIFITNRQLRSFGRSAVAWSQLVTAAAE